MALPAIKNINADCGIKEFISVQPMNLPSGLVFYLDFKYSKPTKLPWYKRLFRWTLKQFKSWMKELT